MNRSSLAAVLLLTACASLPEIELCEPGGDFVEPSFVNLGNDDLMNASLMYRGCPDYSTFRLCGVGEEEDGGDWFSAQRVTVGIWHDGSAVAGCDEEVLVDESFSLGHIRRRYEKAYDTDAATVELDFGSLTVDYTFEPDPR